MQVIPLMQQLRQGGLMGHLEELTKSASAAATDIHRLQNEVRVASGTLRISPAQAGSPQMGWSLQLD